jgi:hypothetical protein
MSAKPGFGFEQHHRVPVGQQMGGGHARNASSDDSDATGGLGKGLERHSGWFLPMF